MSKIDKVNFEKFVKKLIVSLTNFKRQKKRVRGCPVYKHLNQRVKFVLVCNDSEWQGFFSLYKNDNPQTFLNLFKKRIMCVTRFRNGFGKSQNCKVGFFINTDELDLMIDRLETIKSIWPGHSVKDYAEAITVTLICHELVHVHQMMTTEGLDNEFDDYNYIKLMPHQQSLRYDLFCSKVLDLQIKAYREDKRSAPQLVIERTATISEFAVIDYLLNNKNINFKAQATHLKKLLNF